MGCGRETSALRHVGFVVLLHVVLPSCGPYAFCSWCTVRDGSKLPKLPKLKAVSHDHGPGPFFHWFERFRRRIAECAVFRSFSNVPKQAQTCCFNLQAETKTPESMRHRCYTIGVSQCSGGIGLGFTFRVGI